jgi:glycosyltransferase involved in cell wall biosynthesis
MHSSLPRQLENFNFGNWSLLIKLFESLERRVLRSCDALIVIDSELEAYVRGFDLKAEPVRIENLALHLYSQAMIPDSIQQLKQKLLLNGRLPVVYTGTFERYQGLEMLLESIRTVKTFVPEVFFIFVGGKPYQIQALLAQTRQEQVEKHVYFTGIVPIHEAMAYLELAEVVVSSRVSGTAVPLKIYSYLQAGKPILATRLPAHTQVLNDEIALLVEPTAAALAMGIVKLLRTPALRESLGEKAQQFAREHHHGADNLTKVDNLYRNLQPMSALS